MVGLLLMPCEGLKIAMPLDFGSALRSMQNSSAQEPSAFSVNAAAGLFSEAELQLARELASDGQTHLFANWDEPGVNDEEKRRS